MILCTPKGHLMKSSQDMKVIQIEITNGCTHTCSNCTRFCGHHKRPFFMDSETFRKAVDSMQGFKGIVGIMGGEPTIHPKFAEFVEYFRENFGEDDPSSTVREPTRDFVGYIVDNVFDIDVNNQRGLWTSVGRKYYEHFELIQDTFGYQAINDHQNPSMHETLMVTRKELGIPDAQWIPMRDNCWIQNYWSASISPKGAFFCEIAAALDMLFDGPGGWDIEPGWWKRTPKDFADQLHWCELCSAPLAMPKRDAREEIDDVSPVWFDKLNDVGSRKLKRGKVSVFDVQGYNASDHEVIAESLPYMKDQSQRIADGNRSMYPSDVSGVMILPATLDNNQAAEALHATIQKVPLSAAVSENASHREVAQELGIAFLHPSSNREQDLFGELKDLVGPAKWVLLLHGPQRLSSSLTKCLESYVFNPGCLYVSRKKDKNATCDSRFEFFNLRASSLKDGGDLQNLGASYPCEKTVQLDQHFHTTARIYLAYHDDTVRVENDILTPIQVGKALSTRDLHLLADDTGDNISPKNAQYAELSAQYWAWKNDTDSDYLGFGHYRRVFIFRRGFEKQVNYEKDRVPVPGVDESSYAKYGWREADVLEVLEGCDIVVPMQYDVRAGHRTDCRGHFIYHHGEENYRDFLTLVDEFCPEYRAYAKEFFRGQTAYLCNMFIMRRELLHEYSEWLFGILDRFMESKTEEDYDAYQIRMPAFMAERLFNIYLKKLRHDRPDLKVKEVPYALIEVTTLPPRPLPAIQSEKPVVPVVTAFDHNYVPYFAASLASMLDYVSTERYYDLVILGDDLTSVDRTLLDGMIVGRNNVGIRYINMAGLFADETATHTHFTKSTFNRLKLPELLPEYDKVVYIDPDTIVLRDLGELFDLDVNDYYAGAVLDYTYKMILRIDMRVHPQFGGTTVREYLNNYLELREEVAEKYFNAGVMLFNLSRIREKNLTRAFDRLFKSRAYYAVDQDILNKAFDGEILHVNPSWNVITQPLDEIKKAPYPAYKEYEASRRTPFILHFAGSHLKPWNNPNVDYAEFFWEYCRRTPFYEQTLIGMLGGSCHVSGNGRLRTPGSVSANGSAQYTGTEKVLLAVAKRLQRVSPRLHDACYRAYRRVLVGQE